MSAESPLNTVRVSETARAKRDRYLTPAQLRTVLLDRDGYVCRKNSPNHEGLYDETKFIVRGRFFETDLDVVFAVEPDRLVVVTQMSQHADSLRGRFYQQVGTTVKTIDELVDEQCPVCDNGTFIAEDTGAIA